MPTVKAMARRRETLPPDMRWLFPEIDTLRLDLDTQADGILARVLEQGGTADVQWAIRKYGRPRIHQFFREVGHPELSPRTIDFWRALLHAADEEWQSPPAWRKSRIAPWIY